MQHDTTLYQVKLGEQRRAGFASLIYLRYCKRRYLSSTAPSIASR